MLYKRHGDQIKELQNLPKDQLQIRQIYNSNQLWDEVNLQTSTSWIMEFASFLRLDKNQYYRFIIDHTQSSKQTQSYQLFNLERRLNFTDDQVKRFVLYRTFMMNDPEKRLYKLYISKDLEIDQLEKLNYGYGIDEMDPAPENPTII